MEDDRLKLSNYLAERRRSRRGFVSDLLLGLYEEHRIASSVVLRGIGGFGAGHHLRTDESLTLSERGLPLWQKLMIYTSESAQCAGTPIHRAIVQQLWRRKTPDGATVLRGIWGFHGEHRPHGDKLLSLRRQVPVVTIVIDTPANIAESFEVVDAITCHEGVVTGEMVPALVSDEGDAGRGRPHMARQRY
jgi:PII-like signaling protein